MKKQLNEARAKHIIGIAQKVFPGNPYGTDRKKDTVDIKRAIFTILLKEGESISAIGRYFNLDHSTVSFSILKHDNLFHFNQDYRDKYCDFLKMFNDPKVKQNLKDKEVKEQIDQLKKELLRFSDTLRSFTKILNEHINNKTIENGN